MVSYILTFILGFVCCALYLFGQMWYTWKVGQGSSVELDSVIERIELEDEDGSIADSILMDPVIINNSRSRRAP